MAVLTTRRRRHGWPETDNNYNWTLSRFEIKELLHNAQDQAVSKQGDILPRWLKHWSSYSTYKRACTRRLGGVAPNLPPKFAFPILQSCSHVSTHCTRSRESPVSNNPLAIISPQSSVDRSLSKRRTLIISLTSRCRVKHLVELCELPSSSPRKR